MTELVATTEIKQEKGFMYFCKTDENGNIEIHRAKRGRKPKDETPINP